MAVALVAIMLTSINHQLLLVAAVVAEELLQELQEQLQETVLLIKDMVVVRERLRVPVMAAEAAAESVSLGQLIPVVAETVEMV